MDPLSIAGGCVGLVASIAQLSVVINGFVRGVRDARGDLDAVNRELLSLKTVLELLADDVSATSKAPLPDTLQRQISGIVTNCGGVVADIEETLQKYDGKSVLWTISGKGDMAKLRSALEAHKSALDIALDMVNISITREVKNDTTAIRDDTEAIRQDTAQILAEISRLQAKLPDDEQSHGPSAFMLQRYLDNLTSYAETVVDDQDLRFEDLNLGPGERQENPPPAHNAELISNASTSFEPYTPPKENEFASSSYKTQHKPVTNVSPNRRPHFESASNPIPVAGHDPPTGAKSDRREERKPTLAPTSNFKIESYSSSSHQIKVLHWIYYRGNLIFDKPVPEEILSQVPHAAPPDRDEFTHSRYTVITCEPDQLVNQRYTLRPTLFAKPRVTELLITVRPTNDLHQLIGTIQDTMKLVEFLEARSASPVWGLFSWKRVVLCLILDLQPALPILHFLESLGIYSPWGLNGCDLVQFTDGDKALYSSEPSSVQGKRATGYMYEYSVQLTKITNERLVSRGPKPIQMVCLRALGQHSVGDERAQSMRWTEGLVQVLKAEVAIHVEPGVRFKPERPFHTWRQSKLESQKPLGLREIVVYKPSIMAKLGFGSS